MEVRTMSKQKNPDHPIRRVLREESKTWAMVVLVAVAYLIITGG